jgi:hydroxymethylbilane synthase
MPTAYSPWRTWRFIGFARVSKLLMIERATHPRKLRLGTRGSKLARWQADWVAERMRQFGHAVELVEISTRGDIERAQSIEEIGTRGVFTKEIQRALLAGEIDLAVHSLKDLPTEPIDGLLLAAVPPRESPADALIVSSKSGVSSDSPLPAGYPLGDSPLPFGAHVGTGSLRRQAQLRHARPDLKIGDIRGNVDTRLRKLDGGEFDAIVLAEAGLRRLGLTHRIAQVLPFELMMPAVGQGALAVECRQEDDDTRMAIAPLDDSATHAAVLAERELLAHLRGGCMAPVGAMGRWVEDKLHLAAVVLSADGSRRLAVQSSAESANRNDAERLGRKVAEDLLQQGAAELIHASRSGHVT